jgi:hypothetical protein
VHVYYKWHGSFLHNTNDCVVFRQQMQSAINEDRLRFQEVKIDMPHVPITTLVPTNKKVWVRPCAADKGKGKNIITVDPHTPNMSCIVVNLMASNKRNIKGTRGTHDRTSDHSHPSCVRQTIWTLRPDSPGDWDRHERSNYEGHPVHE